MTIENRIVFDLAEIKAIIFECESCESRISLSPKDAKMPPYQCPTGHQWPWNVDMNYESTQSPFRALLSSLARLQEYAKNGRGVGFRVLLELNGASDPASSAKD